MLTAASLASPFKSKFFKILNNYYFGHNCLFLLFSGWKTRSNVFETKTKQEVKFN